MAKKKRNYLLIADDIILNISKLSEVGLFYRVSNLKDPKLYSLKDIDFFTAQFSDEADMKTYLIRYQILPVSRVNKKIKIINTDNEGGVEKVKYDLLYQKDMELMANPILLMNKLYDKFLCGEYDFLEKLFSQFLGDPKCRITIAEATNMLHDIVNYNKSNSCLYELDKNGHNVIQRTLRLLIFESKQERNGKIEYLDKFRWKNIHHMIAFINFQNNQEVQLCEPNLFETQKNDDKDETSSINDFNNTELADSKDDENKSISSVISNEIDKEEEIDPDKYIFEDEPVFGKDEVFGIEPSKVISKTKKRVRKIVPNQISLFDDEEK